MYLFRVIAGIVGAFSIIPTHLALVNNIRQVLPIEAEQRFDLNLDTMDQDMDVMRLDCNVPVVFIRFSYP